MKRALSAIFILVLAVSQALASDPSVIKMRIGAFSTRSGMPSYKNLGLERSEAVKSGEQAYYIVQFDRNPDDNLRSAVERAGGRVFDYLPSNAHVVKMNLEAKAELERTGLAGFVGYFQPAFRVSPDLLEPQKSHPKEEQGRIELNVLTFEVADRVPVRERLLAAKAGSVFLNEDQEGRMFQVSIPADQAVEISKALANYPEVRWVERKFPVELHNAWTRWINQSRDTTGMKTGTYAWYAKLRIKSADDSLKMPLYRRGIYGQGQIVHVDDTGMDWDNIYFRDPGGLKPQYDKNKDTVYNIAYNGHRKIVGYNVHADTFDLTSSGHGSHTTGSVAGDSMGSTHSGALSDTVLARAMGMAPLAKIAFTDIGNTSDGLVLPTNYADIYRWGYNAGARISSSSWGQSAGGYSYYTANCEQLDTVAWQHQNYLMFRSAGNSNLSNDSVNTPATGKNIVCVGSAISGFQGQDYGGDAWSNPGMTTNKPLNTISFFSSHGPTKEKMLRPHLVACGSYSIWSVDSDGSLTTNNAGITYMGGTSMSTPATAGLAALVRQYLTEGWWKTGTKVAGDAISNPPATLVKALMLLSTRNSSGAYSNDAIGNTANGTQNVPTQGQGWGAVTLDDALYFSGDTRKLRLDDTRSFTASGQSFSYTITTGTSTDTMNPFKVVLSYFDYPSALSPMDISVNNLNLSVSDGSGNTYLGNVFGTNGKSTTGGVADTINNDEVVWLLPAAAKGSRTMTITVTAQTIVRSPQPFSITAGGDIIASTNFRGDAALAVAFAGMNLTASTEGVNLTWRTESEQDCLRWEIERSDNAEQGFVTVGRVDGGGTTSQPKNYSYADNTVTEKGEYFYRLAEIDVNGNTTYYGPMSIGFGGEIPAAYLLAQSMPNPSSGKTSISFALKKPGNTSLKIYNIAGQTVKTLVSENRPAGNYTIAWDGRDDRGQKVSNGIYLYRLISGDFQATKKITVLR
jgi:hypothetical protein